MVWSNLQAQFTKKNSIQIKYISPLMRYLTKTQVNKTVTAVEAVPIFNSGKKALYLSREMTGRVITSIVTIIILVWRRCIWLISELITAHPTLRLGHSLFYSLDYTQSIEILHSLKWFIILIKFEYWYEWFNSKSVLCLDWCHFRDNLDGSI